ncbi:MAG: hypothetical protein ACE1ZA_11350 [Pseudomonadales bacterium]
MVRIRTARLVGEGDGAVALADLRCGRVRVLEDGSRWMWPWAAVYTAQVAVAMLVFTMRDPRGSGLTFGLIAFTIFLVPAVALWRAKTEFQGEDGQ